jgi:hypothetical protein
MTAQKKLIPLSFSVSEFLAYLPVPISNITYAFPSITVLGKQNLVFQLIYQDLNSNHGKLVFEQSLDGINYDNIEDTSGNPIFIDLLMADTSVTINLFNINTAFIRCVLVLNNLTLGSFTDFIYLLT